MAGLDLPHRLLYLHGCGRLLQHLGTQLITVLQTSKQRNQFSRLPPLPGCLVPSQVEDRICDSVHMIKEDTLCCEISMQDYYSR